MVVRTLSGGSTEMPKNWNRRFKHNRDKMKTGNIFELAEVVRNLAVRNNEKGLSTGEKQMFVKAKKILASELMYAKGMDEDEAAAWLDDVLSRAGQTSRSRERSPRPPPRTRSGVLDRFWHRRRMSGHSSSLRAPARGSASIARRRLPSSAGVRSSPRASTG